MSRGLICREFPSPGRIVYKQSLPAKNMSMYSFFIFQFSKSFRYLTEYKEPRLIFFSLKTHAWRSRMVIVNCLKQMNELNIKTTMAVAFSSSSLEEHKSAWVEGGFLFLGLWL